MDQWPEVTITTMKHVIDTSELLGVISTREGSREICATAEAQYTSDATQLEIWLDAFLRTTDLRTKESRSPAPWLPKSEIIRESIGPNEAAELARDIFHRWVRKVRDASPPPA